jgi:hypothetical protein
MKNLKKILLCGAAALMLVAPMTVPARAYDCYDGKSDDCTAEWSLAHKPTPKPSALIAKEEHLDNLCRGSGKNSDCLAREKLYYRLNNMGWCYGKENQGAPQYQWHHCGSNSIKSTKESIHQYE